MPTIARIGPYRIFFFSNEGIEPPHVHIERDDCVAKFWLDPVGLAENDSFKANELRKLRRIVVDHQQNWLEKWRDFHRGASAR